MSLWSSVCNGFSSALSAVGNFVGSCIGKIGNVIGGRVGEILSPFNTLDLAIKVISVIVGIATYIGEELGLIKKDEQLDELGAKAIQEDTLPRDEFKSEQEYIKYLREEIELDREKFKVMTKEEKLACSAIGVSILTKSIEEKTGVEIPTEFLLNAEKIKLSAEEIKVCIEKFKDNGLVSMVNMSDYLQGKDLKGREPFVSDVIVNALKEANPQMSQIDIENKMAVMIDDTHGSKK